MSAEPLSAEYPAWVDEHIPPRGPCAFCGGEADARHRVIDSILEYLAAGDPVESVAGDFDLPVDFVLRLMTLSPCPSERLAAAEARIAKLEAVAEAARRPLSATNYQLALRTALADLDQPATPDTETR